MCANFVLADSHLALEPQDLFTANQVLHLKPLIGERSARRISRRQPVRDALLSERDVGRRAKAFAERPDADGRLQGRPAKRWARGVSGLKTLMELVLRLPAPFIEASCRRLYAWHLRRRSGSWRSPDQVRLHSDYLKLHTQSHRRSVLDRFDAAVEHAIQRADYEAAPRAAAGGRR